MKKYLWFLALIFLFVSCITPAPTSEPNLLAPSRTPRPSRTPVVSITPTIEATTTITATIIPPTPSVTPPHNGDHDVNIWHEPGFGHHHGHNPENFPELWAIYLAQTGQEIGYPWLSKVTENVWPFPHGDHEGFKFLAETDTNCIQIDPPAENQPNCIKSYLVLVHSMGTVHHLYTRIHSNYGVFEVCSLDLSECGYVATGGLVDYGVTHAGYKREICQLPGDPPSYPYDTAAGLNRLPYRAAVDHSEKLPTETENIEFWNSSGPGAGNIKNYPHRPNTILGLSWSAVDSWDYMDVSDCDNLELAIAPCPDGSCALNGTSFQVFAIRLQNLPSARPFSGWTDVDGHVDPTCTETSPICVPLVITDDVPLGNALLSKGVRQGKCDQVLCQEFDNGTPLYAPGFNGN